MKISINKDHLLTHRIFLQIGASFNKGFLFLKAAQTEATVVHRGWKHRTKGTFFLPPWLWLGIIAKTPRSSSPKFALWAVPILGTPHPHTWSQISLEIGPKTTQNWPFWLCVWLVFSHCTVTVLNRPALTTLLVLLTLH